MTKLCSAFAVLALLAPPVLASSALAENERGPYAGVALTMLMGESNTPYDSAKMSAIEVSGGYKYNAALGLEARFGYGIGDDRDRDSDYFQAATNATPGLNQIEREVDKYTAVYYRPELLNNDARLYGLLGYADVDLVATRLHEGVSEATTTSLSGASYGAGVGWYINTNWNFNIEYRRLVSDGDYRLEAYSLQLDYRF